MHKIQAISAYYWFLITSLRKYRLICMKCHHDNKANLFFANPTGIVIKLSRIRQILEKKSDGYEKMLDFYKKTSEYMHKIQSIPAHYSFLITSFWKYRLICIKCHHENKANLFFANPTLIVIKLSRIR